MVVSGRRPASAAASRPKGSSTSASRDAQLLQTVMSSSCLRFVRGSSQLPPVLKAWVGLVFGLLLVYHINCKKKTRCSLA